MHFNSWCYNSILPTCITYRASLTHISLIVQKSPAFVINLKYYSKTDLFMKADFHSSLHRNFVRNNILIFVKKYCLTRIYSVICFWKTSLQILMSMEKKPYLIKQLLISSLTLFSFFMREISRGSRVT